MDKIQEQWPEWQTVELVGKGTFGSVYKAKKEVYGNISYAAIKVIEIPKEPREIRDLQQSDMDESSIKAFYEDMIHNLMSEIQIMESMKSANGIVGIEDYKVVQREPLKWEVFIRMEFLEDLQTYLERHPMTGREVVQMGMDLCEALKNCEIAGIVHRDVKIDNVFVNRFGSFKLGDFGIAKQLGKTRAAMSQKGTNMYMAPEIFRGEPYDARVDIYSLGILLYRLLNKGRFPFMPLWRIQLNTVMIRRRHFREYQENQFRQFLIFRPVYPRLYAEHVRMTKKTDIRKRMNWRKLWRHMCNQKNLQRL